MTSTKTFIRHSSNIIIYVIYKLWYLILITYYDDYYEIQLIKQISNNYHSYYYQIQLLMIIMRSLLLSNDRSECSLRGVRWGGGILQHRQRCHGVKGWIYHGNPNWQKEKLEYTYIYTHHIWIYTIYIYMIYIYMLYIYMIYIYIYMIYIYIYDIYIYILSYLPKQKLMIMEPCSKPRTHHFSWSCSNNTQQKPTKWKENQISP